MIANTANITDLNILKLECLDDIMHITDFNLIKQISEYIKSKKKATERLDPYLISPSGDEFWSYPENVQKLNEAIKEAHSPNRKVAAVLNSEEEIHKFFAEL